MTRRSRLPRSRLFTFRICSAGQQHPSLPHSSHNPLPHVLPPHSVKMPGTVTRTPVKRALAEASSNRANVLASPRSAKKLKLDNGKGRTGPPVKMANSSFNSSQPAPSQFEETLEKMTQDMETLKESNTEKDQQWRRPPLPTDFSELKDKLVFQQIEAEEGVLNGGRTTVKLFGVTEVRRAPLAYRSN
jgi:DNA polymerase delta subunit 1